MYPSLMHSTEFASNLLIGSEIYGHLLSAIISPCRHDAWQFPVISRTGVREGTVLTCIAPIYAARAHDVYARSARGYL